MERVDILQNILAKTINICNVCNLYVNIQNIYIASYNSASIQP